MGRHDYAVTDVGEFGVRAQPALARRTRGHLLLARIGAALALAALVCAAAVARTFAVFEDATAWWPPLLLGGAIGMLAVCALQAWVWGRAMSEWTGRRDVNLAPFVGPSWWAHLLSYPIGLAALVGAFGVLRSAPMADAAFWWALAAVPLLIAAQLTGALEYFRLGGPRGTLPAHFRRLVRTQNPPPLPAERLGTDEPGAGADEDLSGATRAEDHPKR